jgi:nucleoid DNA-binding protein
MMRLAALRARAYTGETMQIAAKKKLGFSAAKAVKDRLNG